MAVFKRLICRSCRKQAWAEKEEKKAPACADCGGETQYSEKWYVSRRVLDENGRKRKVVKAIHKNKRVAQEYDAKLVSQVSDEEIFERPKSILFEKAAESFLEFCENRVGEGRLSERTVDFYRQIIDANLVPFFRGIDLKKIGPNLCEQYKQERREAKRKVRTGKGKTKELDRTITPAAVNRELSTLKRLLSVMVSQGKIRRNPMLQVESLEENNHRDRYLEPAEMDRLLEECRTPHLYMAVLLALDTGLRLDGCLSIKWVDINFQRGELTRIVKGGKKVTVPLTKRLEAALKTHKETQKIKSINGYVIPSPVNPDKPMRRDADFGFRTACKNAGIKDFTFHDLRHSFVSLFLARTNGDIFTCSQIVGHSTSTMTERYAHLLDHHRREAMRRFEEG